MISQLILWFFNVDQVLHLAYCFKKLVIFLFVCRMLIEESTSERFLD